MSDINSILVNYKEKFDEVCLKTLSACMFAYEFKFKLCFILYTLGACLLLIFIGIVLAKSVFLLNIEKNLYSYMPALLITGFVIIVLTGIFERFVKKSAKRACMPKFIEVFDNLKWIKPPEVFNTLENGIFTNNELLDARLFDGYTEKTTDDSFIGSYDDIKFKISEIKLFKLKHNKEGRPTRHKVFGGIVIGCKLKGNVKNRFEISTKNEFKLTNTGSALSNLLIFVMAAAFVLFAFFGSIKSFSLENINSYIVSLLFVLFIIGIWLVSIFAQKRYRKALFNTKRGSFSDKYFNFYFEAQGENKMPAMPELLSIIQKIKNVYQALNVDVAFFDDNVFVAINTGRDFFEFGGVSYKPFEKNHPLEMLFNPIACVYMLCNHISKNQDKYINESSNQN